MVERNEDRTRPHGMNTSRARCSGSGPSGSEGGPGNPIGRTTDRAPRSDPCPEHHAGEGKLDLRAIKDLFATGSWATPSSPG